MIDELVNKKNMDPHQAFEQIVQQHSHLQAVSTAVKIKSVADRIHSNNAKMEKTNATVIQKIRYLIILFN